MTRKQYMIVGFVIIGWLGLTFLGIYNSGSFGMTVKGKIVVSNEKNDHQCTLRLMNFTSPIWKKSKVAKPVFTPLSLEINQEFEEHFILHGPSDRKHFFEIICPGYQKFRTKEFLAPNMNAKEIDLNEIKLKKLR